MWLWNCYSMASYRIKWSCKLLVSHGLLFNRLLVGEVEWKCINIVQLIQEKQKLSYDCDQCIRGSTNYWWNKLYHYLTCTSKIKNKKVHHHKSYDVNCSNTIVLKIKWQVIQLCCLHIDSLTVHPYIFVQPTICWTTKAPFSPSGYQSLQLMG